MAFLEIFLSVILLCQFAKLMIYLVQRMIKPFPNSNITFKRSVDFQVIINLENLCLEGDDGIKIFKYLQSNPGSAL